MTARSSRAGTPRTSVGASSSANSGAPGRRRARHRLLHELIEPHVLDRVGRLLLARQLDEVADQAAQLLQLLDDVAQQPPPLLLGQPRRQRQHLDVRAQARQRRAQLVRGVGDELPLAADRRLQRAEHRVEGARQPRDLVVGGRRLDVEQPPHAAADGAARGLGHVDPPRQIAGRPHVLDRRRQLLDRPQRGPRDDAAERRRQRDPADAHQHQHEREPVERAVDVGQRPRDLDGDAGRGGDRQDPHRRAVDVGVAEELVVPAGRDRLRVGIDRQPRLPVGARGRIRLPSSSTAPT